MTHTSACRYAQSKSAHPWNWADGMDPEEAAYHSISHGGDFHVACFGALMGQVDEPASSMPTAKNFGNLSVIS